MPIHLYGLVLRQAITVSYVSSLCLLLREMYSYSLRQHCLNFAISTFHSALAHMCRTRLAFNRYKATLFAIDANTNCRLYEIDCIPKRVRS